MKRPTDAPTPISLAETDAAFLEAAAERFDSLDRFAAARFRRLAASLVRAAALAGTPIYNARDALVHLYNAAFTAGVKRDHSTPTCEAAVTECLSRLQQSDLAAQAGTAPADELRKAATKLLTEVDAFAASERHLAQLWANLMAAAAELRAALAVGAPTKGQAQMELCVQLNAAYQAIDYLSAKVVALESGGAPAAPAPDRRNEVSGRLSQEAYKALEAVADEVCGALNSHGLANWTVCPECCVDDFVHVEGCELGAAPGRAPSPEPAGECAFSPTGNHVSSSLPGRCAWCSLPTEQWSGGAPPAAPTPNAMSTNAELVVGAARPAEPPPDNTSVQVGIAFEWGFNKGIEYAAESVESYERNWSGAPLNLGDVAAKVRGLRAAPPPTSEQTDAV